MNKQISLLFSFYFLFCYCQKHAIAQIAPSAETGGIVNQVIPETAYTLGAGDQLRVEVFDVPEYSNEYQVLIDGTINLPVIGSLLVRGLTIPQVTQFISQQYAPFVLRPVVTVNLIALRPVKIGISGEVNSPGFYTVALTADRQFPTLTEAIKLAGGLTGTADVGKVQLRRRFQGQKQMFVVSLWELFQESNTAFDITLRDGDTIVVLTSNNVDLNQNSQLATASFAPEITPPLKIALVGEVHRPGAYIIRPQEIRIDRDRVRSSLPTLTEAISQAGGITQQADIRRIQVRRPDRRGNTQMIRVDLWQLLQAGDLSQDALLHDGDTIVIPTALRISPTEAPTLANASFSPDTINVNVVGEVPKPGIVQVPPNTPLNQALLAAGGFDNRRASKASVELIRLNANGTVSQRKIKIDLAAGISDRANPPLQQNDVIVVRRSTITSVSDALGTITTPFGKIFSLVNFLRIFD